MTITLDLAQRSAEIHWPDGYSPVDADLFAHNRITVDRSVEEVWAVLVAARDWPTWYSNATDVAIQDGADQLSSGSVFDWTTFGLEVSSTVAEFVHAQRIGWYGTSEGLRAYHTWLLVPEGAGTYVVMEEVGFGPAAEQLAASNPGHMTAAM
jgi:hypothetical protein